MRPKSVIEDFVEFHDFKSSIGWLYYYYLKRKEIFNCTFVEWLCAAVNEVIEEMEDVGNES